MDHLKSLYEGEKLKLEKRLLDEKSKADQLYHNMIEEYEQRFISQHFRLRDE